MSLAPTSSPVHSVVLTDLQRQLLDAIARITAEADPLERHLKSQRRNDRNPESCACWIAVDLLARRCPLRFAETFAELHDELRLIVLWLVPGVERLVTLTPYGAYLRRAYLAECRHRETVVVPASKEQPKVMKQAKRSVLIPYWVDEGSPALTRAERQLKHTHERYLPWPEGVPDHRQGPVEEAIMNEEAGVVMRQAVREDGRLDVDEASGQVKLEPVTLFGQTVPIDRRLGRKGGRKTNGRRRTA